LNILLLLLSGNLFIVLCCKIIISCAAVHPTNRLKWGMGDERVTRNNKPKMEEAVAKMAEQLSKLMQDQATNFAAIKKSQKELMNSHKEIQADIQGLKQRYDEVNEHVSQTNWKIVSINLVSR
jgi:hypothetical protein